MTAGIVMTLVIGLISISVILYLLKRTTTNQTRTQQLTSRITRLFAASQKIGIEAAYENRREALKPVVENGSEYNVRSFVSRFKKERKLIVVGSSLLGLRMYVQNLEEILRYRTKRGYETKFMLTHPCFSRIREHQEGRYEGQIRKEIEKTALILEDCGLDLRECVRFYRGTPTCFVVITSDAMLINPYPYQIEGFRTFCLEVRRLPQPAISRVLVNRYQREISIPQQVDRDRYQREFLRQVASENWKEYDYSLEIGPDIYGQFYWYHYLLPWFSRQAVSYREFQKLCLGCHCLEAGYSKEECIIRKSQKKVGPRVVKEKLPVKSKVLV